MLSAITHTRPWQQLPRAIPTESSFHWNDVSSFKFIPVIHRGRCSKHRKARKRYRTASFWYSLNAAKGLRRFDCKAMIKSKNLIGWMTVCNNCSHFLIFILFLCAFFFILKTYFGSFLFIPLDGSRALHMQGPFSHQAINILIVFLLSASSPESYPWISTLCLKIWLFKKQSNVSKH